MCTQRDGLHARAHKHAHVMHTSVFHNCNRDGQTAHVTRMVRTSEARTAVFLLQIPEMSIQSVDESQISTWSPEVLNTNLSYCFSPEIETLESLNTKVLSTNMAVPSQPTLCCTSRCVRVILAQGPCYGQFSKIHVCCCGLDPGNLKFETVRTNKQQICFQDLRRSI